MEILAGIVEMGELYFSFFFDDSFLVVAFGVVFGVAFGVAFKSEP